MKASALWLPWELTFWARRRLATANFSATLREQEHKVHQLCVVHSCSHTCPRQGSQWPCCTAFQGLSAIGQGFCSTGRLLPMLMLSALPPSPGGLLLGCHPVLVKPVHEKHVGDTLEEVLQGQDFHVSLCTLQAGSQGLLHGAEGQKWSPSRRHAAARQVGFTGQWLHPSPGPYWAGQPCPQQLLRHCSASS